jgi:hypothetical protein
LAHELLYEVLQFQLRCPLLLPVAAAAAAVVLQIQVWCPLLVPVPVAAAAVADGVADDVSAWLKSSSYIHRDSVA